MSSKPTKRNRIDGWQIYGWNGKDRWYSVAFVDSRYGGRTEAYRIARCYPGEARRVARVSFADLKRKEGKR